MTLRMYGATSGFVDIDVPAVAGSASVIVPSSSGLLAAYSQLKILQVVNAIKTDGFSTTSSSAVDVTGLSVNITPSSISNKILVFVQLNGRATSAGNTNCYFSSYLIRGSTEIANGYAQFGSFASGTDIRGHSGFVVLDSPSSTSSTTYKVRIANNVSGTSTVFINNAAGSSSITAMEVSV